MEYKTSNNLRMLKCFPLNWRISKKYAIEKENNPDFYIIDVGSMSTEMWQAILVPETMTLSFTCVSNSCDSFRFKVNSIEEASEIVLKFVKGMNQLKHLKETIYWNEGINEGASEGVNNVCNADQNAHKTCNANLVNYTCINNPDTSMSSAINHWARDDY
jgi:hypothetical protein